MFAERIPKNEYHSMESRRHTQEAVAMLRRSPEFRRYARYVEQLESLQYAWLLGPVCLFIVAYLEFVVGLATNQGLLSLVGSTLRTLSPPWTYAFAIPVLLWAVPWAWMAPWCGFFTYMEPADATAVSITHLIVAATFTFSGRMLLFPPVLTPLRTADVAEWSYIHVEYIMQVLQVFVPLLGPLVAGWLFYLWHSRHYKRVPVIPLPVLTVPPVFAAVSFGWWRYSMMLLRMPLWSLRPILHTLIDTAFSDIGDVLSTVMSTFSALFLGGGGEGTLWAIPMSTIHAVWCVSIAMAWMNLVLVFVVPFVLRILRFVASLLPRDPGTWVLCTLCVGATSSYLFVTNALTLKLAAFLGSAMVVLLLNGFERD